MTGFGRASVELHNVSYDIEVRSLNSKFLDLKIRVPNSMRDLELELRTLISSLLHRGKVELSIESNSQSASDDVAINTTLLKKYYTALQDIADDLGITEKESLSSLLRLPNVIKSNEEAIDEDIKNAIINCIKEACKALILFRKEEGASLQADILQSISVIESQLTKVELYEQERIETVRERILTKINDLGLVETYDLGRLEQELIFYIEKLDVSEEKTRLSQHCRYFREVIGDTKADQIGKKLGFISQEIGREINTLGSKANHIEIQKLVVDMKDALEKIKEQTANVI